jgi:uncharacterized protein YndB with AHSA1/START domain
MDPDKWRSFVQRIDVDASLERTFAAWATAEGLMGWMVMEASILDPDGNERGPGVAANAGDRFRNGWHTGLVGEGVILEVESPRLIRFTMQEGVEVEATMEPLDDGSVMVTMTQTHDLSDEMNLTLTLAFKEGWAFYLANLKSVLEGGKDLRNFVHDIEHRLNY